MLVPICTRTVCGVCTILSCIEWQRFFGLRLQNDLWNEIPFICLGSGLGAQRQELLSQRSEAMPLYTVVLIVWRELWTAEDLFIDHSFFLSSYRLRFSANGPRLESQSTNGAGKGLAGALPASACVWMWDIMLCMRRKWRRRQQWQKAKMSKNKWDV